MTTPIKATKAEARRWERNLSGQGRKEKPKVETLHPEAFMMLVKVYDITCGEDKEIPHVWETSKFPPDDTARCMCGEVTWKQDVDRRRKEFAREQKVTDA